MYLFITAMDVGSKRETGIMLFGNFWPVSGSLGLTEELEKSPWRSAAVGGRAVASRDVCRTSVPWKEPKKNSLLRMTGPPAVKPYWFCTSVGLVVEKKFRAF